MPLYIAQFLIVEENLWMSQSEPHGIIRKEELYRVQTQLFAATDAGHAYNRATAMCSGLEDSHNDGPGDRTNFLCRGIYDLDEVHLDGNPLVDQLEGYYGLDVGLVQIDGGRPEIPSRDALSLFSQYVAETRSTER